MEGKAKERVKKILEEHRPLSLDDRARIEMENIVSEKDVLKQAQERKSLEE